jgi:hypothetical protein
MNMSKSEMMNTFWKETVRQRALKNVNVAERGYVRKERTERQGWEGEEASNVATVSY